MHELFYMICDLDTDGDHDIIFTDCDVSGSSGYWIEKATGNIPNLRSPSSRSIIPDGTKSKQETLMVMAMVTWTVAHAETAYLA